MPIKPIHDAETMQMAQVEGEHPDFYAFKMAFRDAILEAGDRVCEDRGFPKVQDKHLPEYFKRIDPMAYRLWLERYDA